MALIKCKECNNEISDTAKMCPRCGYAFLPVEVTAPSRRQTKLGEKQRNKSLGIALVLTGIVVVVFSIPLFSIIIGVFSLIGGFVLISYGASRISGTHECSCPYCGSKGELRSSASVFKCAHCKNTSAKNADHLETI